MKMFEVGGCVRDELLDIKSKDIDFSVELEVDDLLDAPTCTSMYDIMVRNLEAMGVKIFRDNDGVPIGAEHVTARGQAPKDFPNHPGRALDFVLARREGKYTDGRRPDYVEAGTLMDDLARRDFTMNAIAKDGDGSFIDPFGGRDDIDARIIRAVGNPWERIAEDALRALRALRFSITKGFRIEDELYDVLNSFDVAIMMERISDERKKDELDKMFAANTVESMELLNRFPVLTASIFSGSVSLTATMKKRK